MRKVAGLAKREISMSNQGNFCLIQKDRGRVQGGGGGVDYRGEEGQSEEGREVEYFEIVGVSISCINTEGSKRPLYITRKKPNITIYIYERINRKLNRMHK